MSVVYGYIYLLTNKINNKKYVGQTTRTFNERYGFKGKGAERMYKYHYYKMTRGLSYNKHLLSSFEKYGLDNFEVIEKFDTVYIENGDLEKAKKELDDKEKYYIELFDSMSHGYNKTTGGTGDYSIITTFKPDYSIRDIPERVKYVHKFIDRIYYKNNIHQKQIDKIRYYLAPDTFWFNEECDLSTVIYQEKYDLLIDYLFGIVSYQDDRKRGKLDYYKQPKWTIIDDKKLYINNERKKRQNNYIKDTLEELNNLKDELKKDHNIKHLSSLIKDINCIKEYDKNDCNVRQTTESKYRTHYIFDKLKNEDIEYTKNNIKVILKNWRQIELLSESNPHKTIECIKLDFENAFKEIKLTDKQKEVLNMLINNEDTGGKTRHVDYICEKFCKILNKN